MKKQENTVTEYLKKLSWDEYRLLQNWQRDPCYDCPIDDQRIAEKLEAVNINPDQPLFLALLADMIDRIETLEAKLEQLKPQRKI